jgi:hypothetical protein
MILAETAVARAAPTVVAAGWTRKAGNTFMRYDPEVTESVNLHLVLQHITSIKHTAWQQ